jgi:hypothetical protein
MGITEKQILEQVERIRQLRSQGASDERIMEEMKLSHGGYWRRVKRMNQIDRQIMAEKCSTQLSSEVRILESRLHRAIENCESIARDSHIDAKARLEAERLKVECSIAIIRLLREGPSVLNFDKLVQNEERSHRWSGEDREFGSHTESIVGEN